MNIRWITIAGEIIGLFDTAGSGIMSAINNPNPPIIINNIENTIVEMRAQFFNRNKPMLLIIPQVADSRRMSAANKKINLTKAGGAGKSLCSGVTAMDVITAIKTIKPAIRIISADPMRDRIATTVTPAERFMDISSQL
jgi:hypothetical protein